MIFTGFLPNATKKDLRIALGFLLLPWQWLLLRKGRYIRDIEEKLKNYFQTPYTYTFDSGRTALQKALEALQIHTGDEILVQAYTCIVVSNAIRWAGGTPVYVDIQDDFNMDPHDLVLKITNRSKVLIIQHTFGTPACLERLIMIAKQHNLIIIEDCAHSLGVKHQKKLTGTFGDIGMFSFGSDKVVSSMRGGALITHNKKIGEKIKNLQQQLPLPSRLKTIQHLLSFPAFAIGKPLYKFGGRYFLAILKKCNILGRIIYKREKEGREVPFYPSQYANAFAAILVNQLKDIDMVNEHRKKIAHVYSTRITNKNIILPPKNEESNYLRYTILVHNPIHIIQAARKQGIILGNWYDAVIAPSDSNISSANYTIHSCPHAEKIASCSVNLPTNRSIDKRKIEKILSFINRYG